MVLVPATMKLLGDANWWFPHRFRRGPAEYGVEARFVPAGRTADLDQA